MFFPLHYPRQLPHATSQFIGADAIKFQTHFAEHEMLKGGATAAYVGESLFDLLTRTALSKEAHVEMRDLQADLRHCKKKVDAGAQFLITQLFFENRHYFDFVGRARAAGIDVPIIPGIMPITNIDQVQRFTAMCGAHVPAKLAAAMKVRREDPEGALQLGVAYATLQCADLLRRGAPGIHFYTLNRSPATRAILAALRAQEPWLDA